MINREDNNNEVNPVIYAPAITRRHLMVGAAALTGTALLPKLAWGAAALQAGIHIQQRRPALSPNLYGGFIEHIGSLINHSLWSEVLDDRKFYYGVLEEPEIAPTDRRAARAFSNKWSAVGPLSAIRLDTADPYVGRHSPAVTVTADRPRGLMQGRLAVAAGKRYRFRIVSAASETVQLQAILHWGDGPEQSQSVPIAARALSTGEQWTTHTGEFEVTTASEAARLEIVGTGAGEFKVGAVSLMPEEIGRAHV